MCLCVCVRTCVFNAKSGLRVGKPAPHSFSEDVTAVFCKPPILLYLKEVTFGRETSG